jgi:hypothetical protein
MPTINGKPFTQLTNLNVADTLLVDGSVSINDASPHASAILNVSSTTAGFSPPGMTTVQRDAITTSASATLVISNTDTSELNYWNGTIWERVVSNSTQLDEKSRVGFATSTNTGALGNASIYACTDTTSARTLTISSSTIALGSTSEVIAILIKDESGAAGTNNITIDTEGSETIDGVSSVVITANYGDVALYADGSNLFGIGA